MEITFAANTITLNKELNALDDFVISFCKKLNKHKVKYVIVSGYVAIVFGRSRATEDIDIIVEKMPADKFAALWHDVKADLDCMNAENAADGYEHLNSSSALRFHELNKPLPNIEFKFFKTVIDEFTLNNALELKLNGHSLRISPLELQIAYKLFLGSEKDIEDARHLYKVFGERLNKAQMSSCFVLLGVPREKVNLLERFK